MELERVYFAHIFTSLVSFFGCRRFSRFFFFFLAGGVDVWATKGVFMRLHTAPVRGAAWSAALRRGGPTHALARIELSVYTRRSES